MFLFAFKTAKFSFRTMDYSPWSSKNLIDWNRTKKFMQIRIDELCMCTNFGGCDLFGFGDTATFKKWPNFPFEPWTIVHGGQKIESPQKIHASRGGCEMYANQFWWVWPLQFQRFCSFSSAFKFAHLNHGL